MNLGDATNNRDVTGILLECFPNRECKTFEEFEKKLHDFQRISGTCYARRQSLSGDRYGQVNGDSIPSNIRYAFMVYKCVHSRSDYRATVRGRRYVDIIH